MPGGYGGFCVFVRGNAETQRESCSSNRAIKIPRDEGDMKSMVCVVWVCLWSGWREEERGSDKKIHHVDRGLQISI